MRSAGLVKAAEARAGHTPSAPTKGAGAAAAPVLSRPSGRGKAGKTRDPTAEAAGKAPAASLPAAGEGGGALDAAVPPNRGAAGGAAQCQHTDRAAPTRPAPPARGLAGLGLGSSASHPGPSFATDPTPGSEL